MMSKALDDKTSRAPKVADKTALKKYHKLYQLAKPTMQQGDGPKLRKAFRLALEADEVVQYWSTNTHIFPLEVALIVSEEIGLGVVSTICTLLYGSIEGVELSEVKKIFGAQVAQTLKRLAKLDALTQFEESISTQSARNLVIALAEDAQVVLIKLADNLQKMRMLANFPADQQARAASEAKHIYIPIAHRLGLYTIKAELEDLHLKFTDVKAYHAIADQIRSTKEVRERFIQQFKSAIQKVLKRKGFAFTIKARIKSITSIRNKMEALGLTFDQVYDVFAIRIILDTPPSHEKFICWQVYEVVTNLYRTHPGKFRNWLSHPRSNGYQSLHTTVMSQEGEWVEVQIRTKRMDEVAEQGHAAHWKYKESSTSEQLAGLDTWLSQIRTVLEQPSQDAHELLDTIRADFQTDKTYVVTYKNSLIALPVDATVLDLAFELGTVFGLRCTGAKVNKKLVPYNYVLKQGDQVECITTGAQQVLESWLDFTVTGKARRAIKKFLEQERKATRARGKKFLQEQLKQLGLKWNKEIIKQLLVFLDEEEVESLYYKIGEGIIAPQQLKAFSSVPYKTQRHKKGRLPRQNLNQFMPAFSSQAPRSLIINGREVANYTLAPCCSPVPGDKVSGLINRQQVVELHKETCLQVQAPAWYHDNPIVDIRWSPKNHWAVGLYIESLDRPNMVNELLQVIFKEYPTGIQSTFINAEHGMVYVRVQLKLIRFKDSTRGIKKLEQLQGVISVRIASSQAHGTPL